MNTTQKTTQYLKYEFSEAETTENAQELARKNRELTELELKKRQLVTDLKAESEKVNSDIARLARYVTDGYDFRMLDCEVRLHSPRPGMKCVVRLDTGEVVREEKMSDAERQDVLAFGTEVTQ